MVLFVSLLFSLVVFGELNWVRCEPSNFATANENIFHFAALHSSSIQPYSADNRTTHSELDAKNALKIWLLVRHGSRTAKIKERNVFISMENGLRREIINNFENEKTCPLSKTNWNNLKKWKWNTDFNDDRALTETGKAELKQIAKSYQTRFSDLFKGPFTKANFNVICTDTPRTIKSANVFLDAAIGSKGRSSVLVVAGEKEEEIIKAYKLKEFRKKNKDIEDSGYSLVDKFSNTKKFIEAVRSVNKRLHFTDTENKKRVMNMYDLCRYEGTWTPKAKSVWCSMFTESEILVLEYEKDLNSFTENGPSHEMNKKVHCPSVLDMMKHLSHSDGPKVTAYFTHSPALLLHLTAMGAYSQGSTLTAVYNEDSKYREWNTSKLSPMAANFAAVLYKGNRVKFYLNEKVVHLPFMGCTSGLCDLKTLQSQFNQCK